MRLLFLALFLLTPICANAQTCIGAPPLTQIIVDETIDICLPTTNSNAISALALRQTLQTMTSAIFQNGNLSSSVIELTNMAPLPTVDLHTVVPTNGFYASGSGAIFENCPLIGCTSGDHQQSALYLKATATLGPTIAEYMATFDCNLNAGSGGSPSFDNAKVCVFNSATTGSSAGDATWGMANDLVIGAGDTGSFKVGAEFDITYNPNLSTAPGNRNVYNVYISGNSVNPITAMLALAPVGTTINAHYGILINDTAGTDIEQGIGMFGHFANAAIQIPAGEKICLELTNAVCLSWQSSVGQLQSSFTISAPYLVAATDQVIGSLPTCNSAQKGLRTAVTDGVATPGLGTAVSATGAVWQPVVCNGSVWVYG